MFETRRSQRHDRFHRVLELDGTGQAPSLSLAHASMASGRGGGMQARVSSPGGPLPQVPSSVFPWSSSVSLLRGRRQPTPAECYCRSRLCPMIDI